MTTPTLAQVLEHPIVQALDPRHPFLVARTLPPALNPLVEYGIKVVALVPLRFRHLKIVPAYQMMLEAFKGGAYEGMEYLVVPSSGNTVDAVAELAPAFGLRVKAVMANDVPSSKIGVLQVRGDLVDIVQTANVTETARELARLRGHCLLDQYSDNDNVKAHFLYTGPEIVRALGESSRPRVLAVAMGSAGTITGIGQYLHLYWSREQTVMLGVRPKLGEDVPGARDMKKMEAVVKFPWEKDVDHVVEVGRHESFVAMRRLWSAVEPQPGPTSGMAYAGLVQYMQSLPKEALKRMRDCTVGFVCHDSSLLYAAQIVAELRPNEGIVSA